MANMLHMGKIYHGEKPFFTCCICDKNIKNGDKYYCDHLVSSCRDHCLREKYRCEVEKIDRKMAKLRRKIKKPGPYNHHNFALFWEEFEREDLVKFLDMEDRRDDRGRR